MKKTLIIIGVIALVIASIAFFAETEIRIEVNNDKVKLKYSSYEECILREIQKCNPLNCEELATDYCEILFLEE